MSTWLDLLLAPLSYPFMVRALAASVLVGVVSAVVGTYVVLRGMAFFGDALAHTILPGLAAGYVLGGSTRSLFWWGLGTAVAASLAIGAVSKSARLKQDTAIGVVFAGMFALGIALISTTRSYAVDLAHFLFGDVLGVSASDLWTMAIVGGAVLLAILALYKEFLVLSFDPTLAITLRLPVSRLEYLQLILVAVVIVVSLQTVGVALMVAMLITPAATSYLLTHRMPAMMALAAAFASLSGLIGLYLSFYANVASGAAIVLTATGIFGLVWATQSIWRRLGRTV